MANKRKISQAMIEAVIGMPEDHWRQGNGRHAFVGYAGGMKLTVIRQEDGTIVTVHPGWTPRT